LLLDFILYVDFILSELNYAMIIEGKNQ